MTATTTLPVLFATGVHGSRPAASAVGSGGLYSCTTHSLIYQTDGSTWATWATLTGTGLSDPMTTRGDIIIRNSSNTTARLGIGASGKVLQSDGTDISWQTPSGGSTITTGSATLSGGVVTITSTSAFTDVLSVSLAAGTWVGWASLMCLQTANATSGWDAKIWESGGPTVYGSGDLTVPTGVGLRGQMSIVTAPFVLGGTTTVKLSVQAQGNANLSVSDVTTVGTAKATNLVFLKVA